MTSRNFRTLSWVCNGCKGNVWMASGLLLSFTVLTEEDDVLGSRLEPEEYIVGQLKRWLKCRRLKLSGKRDELLKRVSDFTYQKRESSHARSGYRWWQMVISKNAKLQANCSLSSLPLVPSTGWRAFPSQNIPSLFNYGHVHYYTLESVQDINGAEEIEDGLGQMTDKPLKNGRKYVDSGFVYHIMDTVNGERYFVGAHVWSWPSMRAELPHNVIVVRPSKKTRFSSGFL